MTIEAIEASKVKTHETVWSGVLTPAQLEDLLIKGLREALGTPYSGLSLNVVRVEPSQDGAAALPTIHYDLVHDHEWFWRVREEREGSVQLLLPGETLADPA